MSGGGFMEGSQGSPSGGSGTKKTQLRPVNCHQLRTAAQAHPDAPFLLDGAELGQLVLVGRVLSISKQATSVSYNISDGTAQCDVRQWIDSTDDDNGEERPDSIQQDCYVRITGSLKTFNNKRSVQAAAVKLVHHEESNLIFHHELEVIYVHLALTRGVRGGNQAARGGVPGGMQVDGADGGDLRDFPGPSRRVMLYFRKLGPVDALPGDGIPIDQIHRGAMPDASMDDLREAMEWLVTEGHCFSAADEDHFLPTN